MSSITVITPATGRPELRLCAQSVARQSYRDVEHVVVVDGEERQASVLRELNGIAPKPTVIQLREATGLNNYNGHRIYAALPYLTNSKWVAFLDEDNWLHRAHLENLITFVEENGLQWAYALRNIISPAGDFLCKDNCNSLGWWPSFDGAYHHVDTNCYFLRRDIAASLSHIWNRRSGLSDIERADRAFCMTLLHDYPIAFTTGQYSVNYRIGSRGNAARDRAFYEDGNRIMKAIYRKFPWACLKIAGRLAEHPRIAWELGGTRSLHPTYRTLWELASPLAKRAANRRPAPRQPMA